jgi:two-component system NarL family response regulator
MAHRIPSEPIANLLGLYSHLEQGLIVKSHDTNESAISVYVLEQNRLLRQALVHILRKRTNFTVSGDGDDGAGALEALIGSRCDILLLGSLETLRGICQRAEARERLKEIKVVLFRMEENPESFLEAVHLRTTGYLLKEASSTEIIAAMRAVAQDEATCPPKLCKWLFDYLSNTFSVTSTRVEVRRCATSDLTCRQRQLMELVAEGMTNKEIATNLHLSEFTIKNHIHRVMKSLEVGSRHTAVDMLKVNGLLPGAKRMLH